MRKLDRLIETMGTSRFDEVLVETFTPAVLLRKKGNNWSVVTTHNFHIEEKEFKDLSDLLERYGGRSLYQDGGVCLIVKEQTKYRNLESLLKGLIEKSESLKKLDRLLECQMKIVRELKGLGGLVTSIIEPIPMEIMNTFLLDHISELFSCAVAVYERNEKEFKLLQSRRSSEFPDVLKLNILRRSTVKTHGRTFECFSVTDEGGFQYLFLVYRQKGFKDEEIIVLSTVFSILQKSRELLAERQEKIELERMVIQHTFALELLSNFSMKVLGSKTREEFYKNVVDAVREMFQAKFTALYVKGLKGYYLKEIVTVERVEVPDKLKDSRDVKMGYYTFEIKGESSDILLVVGENIVEDYLTTRIKMALLKMLPSDIERAFRNIEYLEKIKAQRDYIDKINKELNFLIGHMLDFDTFRDTRELVKFVKGYTDKVTNFVIEGLTLYREGRKRRGLEKIVVSSCGSVLGTVYYRKKRNLDEADAQVLNLLATMLLLSAEKIELLKPRKHMVKFEEVMPAYLKAKFRISCLGSNPRIFGCTTLPLDMKGLGVCLSDDDRIYVASDLDLDILDNGIEELKY